MSAWKLVEAVAEESPVDSPKENASAEQNNRNNGGRFNNSTGRGNGRGAARDGRGRGRNSTRPQLTKADRTYLAYMAVQQIELIFTPDNLCMDTFIRSYMDEAGFVPIALVCGYPHVAGYGAPYNDIVSRVQEVAAVETSVFEADLNNETIRLRFGWEMWLMPNAAGGRGQPLYIKQAAAPRQHHNSNYHHNNTHHRKSEDKDLCFDPNAANQQQYWPTLAEQQKLAEQKAAPAQAAAPVAVEEEAAKVVEEEEVAVAAVEAN